jgi:hypothetical protein
MKLTIRILPLIKNFIKKKGKAPAKMIESIIEIFYFLIDNREIQIDDHSKAIIHDISLKSIPKNEKLNLLLKEKTIWGDDLSQWIKI